MAGASDGRERLSGSVATPHSPARVTQAGGRQGYLVGHLARNHFSAAGSAISAGTTCP
jgi:glycerate-2-kinase